MSAHIYWYPSETRGLVKLDLGEPFSDIQEQWEYVTEEAPNGDLEFNRLVYGSRCRARFMLERFTDRGKAAKLRSLFAHLAKGLPVSVAADESYTFAAFSGNWTLESGKRYVKTGGNLFYGYNIVTGLSAGDWFVMRGANPEAHLEEHKVSAWDSDNLKIKLATAGGENTWYTYDSGPVIIRHEGFWPIMYLAPGQRSIITSDRRYLWTLDMQLVDSPGDYSNLYTETGGDGFQGLALSDDALIEDDNGDWSGVDVELAGGKTLQGIVSPVELEESLTNVDAQNRTSYNAHYFKYSY